MKGDRDQQNQHVTGEYSSVVNSDKQKKFSCYYGLYSEVNVQRIEVQDLKSMD